MPKAKRWRCAQAANPDHHQLTVAQDCLTMLVAATSLELVEQALARLKAERARG
jgi:hypothetical protein